MGLQIAYTDLSELCGLLGERRAGSLKWAELLRNSIHFKMPNLVRLCLKLKSNHWDFSEAFCTFTAGIEGLIPGLGKLRFHMPRGVAKKKNPWMSAINPSFQNITYLRFDNLNYVLFYFYEKLNIICHSNNDRLDYSDQ